MEINRSARKSMEARRLDTLPEKPRHGGRIIVSGLSRLGRPVGQVISPLDRLAERGIHFTALKENIIINGKKQDLQAKVMVTLFGLFAEIERDLISERTRAGLAAARAKERQPCRPKWTFQSRLDNRREEIQKLPDLKVYKASIAKITGVSRTAPAGIQKRRRV